jgi:predicted nucleotidyltransferase
VGGYAVMKYTEPRYTKDLDVWVHNSIENSTRLCLALTKFGAPLKSDGVTPETFIDQRIVYQIGVAPVRIDILTTIDGVQFTNAWVRRVKSAFFGVPVHLISLDDLIANKRTAGRSSDLEHLEHIQKNNAKKKRT